MSHFTIIISLLIILLVGCAPNGRYHQAQDSIPTRIPTAAELIDAIPRAEPKSRGGNKDYSVRGKFYQVLASADNFTETGIASFYGEKFHGHLTSNGEIYNMYSMSAAHKHLPLPTYVKVTNLENKKTTIVRVNDRGPFHSGRIIDLSYAAAYKLGISGTAQVKIEAITPFTPSLHTSASPTNNTNKVKKQYIQVSATSNYQAAQTLTHTLSAQYQTQVLLHQENDLYKVLIGPFNSAGKRDSTLQTLKRSGFENAFNKEVFQP